MTDAYILTRNRTVVGAYTTLANAQLVEAKLTTSPTVDIQIQKVTVDYPVTEINAGEDLYQVRYSEVTNSGSKMTSLLGIETQLLEGEYRFDLHSRVFQVAIWNATVAGAETEAETIRAAFVTANGL